MFYQEINYASTTQKRTTTKIRRNFENQNQNQSQVLKCKATVDCQSQKYMIQSVN